VGSYEYKTKLGLVRHVAQSHIHDDRKRQTYPDFEGKEKYVRKDSRTGILMISILGWYEVEEFLTDYFEDIKNPSKRNHRLWKYVD